MLDDLEKSIKATLYDRVTSPLFGSFVFSWVIWNYKFVLVVLSSLAVTDKFSEIANLYANDYAWVLCGFVYPLISAVLFILVYPYPALWAYQFWHQRQKALKEVKYKIDAETLLTREQSREIRQQIARLKLAHEKQLAEKESEIEDLKGLIASMDASNPFEEDEAISETREIKEVQPSDAELTEDKVNVLKTFGVDVLTEDKINVLKAFAALDGEAAPSDIAAKLAIPKVKAEYLLESMVNEGLLAKVQWWEDGRLIAGFELTMRGKGYLVDNNLLG